eukprot:261519-Rhodomonas_salina.1
MRSPSSDARLESTAQLRHRCASRLASRPVTSLSVFHPCMPSRDPCCRSLSPMRARELCAAGWSLEGARSC